MKCAEIYKKKNYFWDSDLSVNVFLRSHHVKLLPICAYTATEVWGVIHFSFANDVARSKSQKCAMCLKKKLQIIKQCYHVDMDIKLQDFLFSILLTH